MTVMQDGIVAGNIYDKYDSSNPIVKYLMKGFFNSLDILISEANVSNVHEIGCGEGNISIHLTKHNLKVMASDFSTEIIDKASENAKRANANITFKTASIYDLTPEDSAELVLCIEVLEHLDEIADALLVLERLANPYLIVSVPREPLWSALNLLRCKYISRLGNTPGHIQHWTKEHFLHLLASRFEIAHVITPIPWIMALCRSKK